MHTIAVDAVQWFWHECRMQIMLPCHSFDDKLECLYIITRGNCIFILEINFMLSLGYFVVGCFDFESHILKFQHYVPTAVFTKVCRRKVEIASLVVQFGGRIAVFIKLEKEEFRFRSKIEVGVSHVL